MKCSLFKTIEKRKRTMMTPRVAAIHDMSGFGRCSLTVAIPILSAMGVQCCPLPTAFLSTHTGGFEGFTFLDMTDEMSKVADHWACWASPCRRRWEVKEMQLTQKKRQRTDLLTVAAVAALFVVMAALL